MYMAGLHTYIKISVCACVYALDQTHLQNVIKSL